MAGLAYFGIGKACAADLLKLPIYSSLSMYRIYPNSTLTLTVLVRQRMVCSITQLPMVRNHV